MTKQIVLLQALDFTPSECASLLLAAGKANLQRRPSPEDWSIADILNHLADVETHMLHRFERVTNEDQPFLPTIHPTLPERSEGAAAADLLRRFEQARAATMTFLKEIAPEEWQRAAVHETRGQTDLTMLVQMLVDHDAEHLSQITETLKRLRTNAIPGHQHQSLGP